MKVIAIDGTRIRSLETFWDEVERVLIPGVTWGRNLDAFDDILHGGFGTPDGGFTLRWEHSELSKAALSYSETVRQLQLRWERCHPDNRALVAEQASLAEQEIGPTVFDWLVEIIQQHGEGGDAAADNVTLLLA